MYKTLFINQTSIKRYTPYTNLNRTFPVSHSKQPPHSDVTPRPCPTMWCPWHVRNPRFTINTFQCEFFTRKPLENRVKKAPRSVSLLRIRYYTSDDDYTLPMREGQNNRMCTPTSATPKSDGSGGWRRRQRVTHDRQECVCCRRFDYFGVYSIFWLNYPNQFNLTFWLAINTQKETPYILNNVSTASYPNSEKTHQPGKSTSKMIKTNTPLKFNSSLLDCFVNFLLGVDRVYWHIYL